MDQALDLELLRTAYASGLDPAELIAALHRRIKSDGGTSVWINVLAWTDISTRIDVVKRRRAAGETLPLFGIPFAVKDNIDIAGVPTTAACPAFSMIAQRSAKVVDALEAAGAIPLGKTNLDQFATGLVGTRSPYGVPSCVFDAQYIPGGSSSGSGVTVAKGLVSFSLGTDTAGSGRVPAAFNNIVGLKPTKGWLSTSGVVPACRSLDCVSVFAGTVEDALTVTQIAAGFDSDDAFSRRAPNQLGFPDGRSGPFRFGIPAEPLEFFGDTAAQALYEASIARLEKLGGKRVAIDFAPFRETCQLLYGGPWVAERLATLKDFVTAHSADMLPVTRDIILGARSLSAADTFQGLYRLAALQRRAEVVWAQMDLMLLPTTGTIYRIDEVEADPVRLNSNLGLYTNFVNLLDLSAIAVPAGFRPNGLPFGVTLMSRAFADEPLAAIASRLHRALDQPTIGATGWALPAAPPTSGSRTDGEIVELAVIGAHLTGEALNHELTERGAVMVRTARTARGYSLYALAGTAQPKPGLVFDGVGEGQIEIEIWAVPSAAVGSFIAEMRAPHAIGTIALVDGTAVKGFLCEEHAVATAKNITNFAGWRGYRKALKVSSVPLSS